MKPESGQRRERRAATPSQRLPLCLSRRTDGCDLAACSHPCTCTRACPRACTRSCSRACPCGAAGRDGRDGREPQWSLLRRLVTAVSSQHRQLHRPVSKKITIFQTYKNYQTKLCLEYFFFTVDFLCQSDVIPKETVSASRLQEEAEHSEDSEEELLLPAAAAPLGPGSTTASMISLHSLHSLR